MPGPAKHGEDHENGILLLEKTNAADSLQNEGSQKMINHKDVEKQQNDGQVGDAHSLGVKHPTTYLESMFHLIKGNSGSGMFAMGAAFKNAGLLLAPVLTLTLGVICVYGNHLLINCSKELARRKKLASYPTFPDTMEWAFQAGPQIFQKYASLIRFLVKLCNTIAQLGFCSVYFLFISSTLRNILLDKLQVDVDAHVLMVIIFVPMVSTAMVRNLKFLVPFSAIANLLSGVAVVLTIYLSSFNLPHISSRPAIADLSRIPLFFGTVIYCFEGIGLVLPLQSEMKKPDQFASIFGVLNVGMTIVGFVLVGLGFVGYLQYGEDVKGSITLNLPQDKIISMIVQVTISVALLFSYALQFHVAVALVWPDVKRRFKPKRPVLTELCVRFGLAMITFIAAEVVPKLELFISLLGSVSSTALALVFPPLCDLALHWGHSPGPNYVFDAISLLLAIIGFSTGSYYSMKDIIKEFFT